MGRRERRARRTRLRRIVVCTTVAIAAVPIGAAQLAGNSVPPSYAGDTTVPVVLTTTLVAGGLDEAGDLTAALSGPAGPLSGLPVTFALAGDRVCVDVVTDAAGAATCDAGPLTSQSPSGLISYTVTFAGLGGLAAASATAEVPAEASVGVPSAPSGDGDAEPEPGPHLEPSTGPDPIDEPGTETENSPTTPTAPETS